MRIVRAHPERPLVERGLSEQDRPRRAKPRHHVAVHARGGRVKPGMGARGRHVTGDVEEILDRDRDAVKRPAVAALLELARRLGGGPARLGGEDLVVGIEPRILAGDPLQNLARQVRRRQGPVPKSPGRVGGSRGRLHSTDHEIVSPGFISTTSMSERSLSFSRSAAGVPVSAGEVEWWIGMTVRAPIMRAATEASSGDIV